jgi:uncharacterized oligopeptide transporter (OPT) family protein
LVGHTEIIREVNSPTRYIVYDRDYIIVIAGGLVLGEGITSILNLGLTAAGVPHLG